MTETSLPSCNADQHIGEATSTSPTPGITVKPPPTRFNVAARDDWALTPDSVRAEVLRLEAELMAGLKKHQAAAARDGELAGFHVRAAGSGTTLFESLSRYVSLEDLLRADPDQGLAVIFRNIGVAPREWAKRLLGPPAETTAEMVEKFAAAHPRFEELSEDIAFFIETGRADDLPEAYDLAQRFNRLPTDGHQVDGGARSN